MHDSKSILLHLRNNFGDDGLYEQKTIDEIPTVWVSKNNIIAVITWLQKSYPLLYDLCGVDERDRVKKNGLPSADFTVVYHLFSFEMNDFIRIKVGLHGEYPSIPSITNIYKNANWYEREVYDMFGITFDGHPHLTRILMPLTWKGHPLRKEHPARATEMGPFLLWDEKQDIEMEALRFKAGRLGIERTQ
jgi:NADH-quinone oxidoreductase subunit C/D